LAARHDANTGAPKARPWRHLGKNLVIAGALLAAGFLGAWLRFRPYLAFGTGLTDGEQAYSLTAGEGLRHAVWDAPEDYAVELAGPGGEGRGTHSPDGRYLVFESGEVGVSRDLWIAERTANGYGAPSLLAELNTSFDEAAPAFGPQGLVFASARPSESGAGGRGGLDLWVASYADGRFGEPMPVEGVNTEANETDPAPFEGGLVFASNRGRRGDHDLFEVKVDALTSERTVERLDAVCTLADEREPTVGGEGRTLLFSSNRTDGVGGYDLWRSFRTEGEWLAPEGVEALNSGLDERAPCLGDSGFGLLFLRAEDGTAGSPLRFQWARSRELFRQPGEAVGWQEVLTLLLLLLLALLAWGAKHWRGLDVLYRCLLVSLILHALLAWWLQDVYPERAEIELPEGESRIALQWRVDGSAAAARRSERGGQLELARASDERSRPERASELVEASQRATAEAALRATEQVAVERERSSATPAAQQLASERSSEPNVQRDAAVESLPQLEAREVAAAPAVALGAEAQVNNERSASSSEASGPQRAAARGSRELAQSAPSAAQPMAFDGEARSAAAQPSANTVFTSAAPASGDRSELAVEGLASPEAREVAGATPLEVGVQSVEVARAEGESSAPQRRAASGASSSSLADARTTLEAADVSGLVARRDRSANRPGRAELDVERRFDGGGAAADLQPLEAPPGPEGLGGAAGAVGAPAEVALGAASDSGAARSSRASSGPQRSSASRSFETPSFSAPSAADAGNGPAPGAMSRNAPIANLSGSSSSAPGSTSDVRVAQAPSGGPWDRDPAPVEAASSGSSSGSLGLEVASGSPTRSSRDRSGPRRFSNAKDDGPRSAPSVAAASTPTPDRGRSATPEATQAPTDKRFAARSGQARVEALERFGGSAETEKAVADGLAYLASIQQRLGYWGDPDDKHSKYGHVVVGKTGLCALAFLGAGHLPGDGGPYGDTLVRALDFLLGVQGERTGHFGDTTSYSHGIATYALGEAAALLPPDDPRAQAYRAGVERAAAWILSQQSDDDDERRYGGWAYYYPDGRVFRTDGRVDTWPRTSITSWQVMALESAKLSGVDVPEASMEAARLFLQRAWDRDLGDYRYSHNPSRLRSSWPTLPASTPAALFALSILGEDLDERRYRAARAAVIENAPRGYRWRGDDAFVRRGEGNLYHWYYGSLAMFRAGGDDWRRWNAALQEALLPAQNDDGSWPLLGGYADDYAGDDRRDLSYTTAMCVLCLEVYYRYLTPVVEGSR
jgi:hypothetical protein